MIVFVRSGRLGNQLFQYFGLASIKRRDERLVLYGFDDLRATFNGVEAIHFPRSSRAERLMALGGSGRVSRPAALDGVAALVDSRHQREAFNRLHQAVLQKFLHSGLGRTREDSDGRPERAPDERHLLGTNGYFENCHNIDDSLLSRLRFRPMVLGRADNFLAEAGLEARGFGFLHLRLEDLSDRAPDTEWFKNAVAALREDRPSLPIVIASNDQQQAQRLARTASRLFVSGLDAAADLALMSLADAGILSVGTFGWWGARLAAVQGRGPFIAPSSTYGLAPQRWSSLGHLELKFI